ncbi:hypothetical protein ABK040_006865 [Willaertia magna]
MLKHTLKNFSSSFYSNNFGKRNFHINKYILDKTNVVTRFAPSPTGFMHLGALRTALFNFLIAKKYNGKFYLRIEDTDQKRLVKGSIDQIQKTIQWANLKTDKVKVDNNELDFVIQSERTPIYQHYVNILLEKGYAYKCYCTEERLDELRTLKGTGFKYDRQCLYLSDEEKAKLEESNTPYTIRMKIPDDKSAFTVFEDIVYGKIKVENKTLDDQVLLKSDGTPTYHLANVVDDHLMGVTHVIRGQEWIASTPKHCILYDMFGWERPNFVHLPLLCNEDGTKLSKRQGHASVDYYVELGYLPEALVNFVALLGWHPSDNQEIFTMQQLIDKFEASSINKGNCKVDLQKLEWINSQHIRMVIENDMERFIELLKPYLKDVNIPIDNYFRKVLFIGRERLKRVPDFVDFFDYFFFDVKLETDEAKELLQTIEKKIPDYITIVPMIRKELEAINESEWNEETIGKVISTFAQTNKSQVKAYGNIVSLLRYYLTGKKIGPGINQVIETLGRDVVLKRLTV